MAETILGMDVRNGEIRLTQLTRQLMKASVTGFARATIGGDATPEKAAQLARELADSQNLSGTTIVLGLPAAEAMVRRLTFPFASIQKIRQVLAFEMEQGLPVPVSTVNLDVMKTRQISKTEQRVLAAALPKARLEEWLAAMAEAGFNPDMVGLTATSLMNLVRSMPSDFPEHCLLLDIGSKSTEVLYIRDGFPVVTRTLRSGVDDFVDKEGNLPADSQPLAAFARQVSLSVFSASPDPEETGPEAVILAGAGGLKSELAEALSAKLSIECKPLGGLGQPQAAGAMKPEEVTAFSGSLGLALTGFKRSGAFNFRSGSHSASMLDFDFRKHAVYAAVATLIVALAWGFSVGMDIHLLSKEVDQTEQSITGIIKRVAPDVKGDFSRAQYLSILQSRIDELRRTAQSGMGDGSRVVDVMREVTTQLPPSLKITINTFTVDEDQVQISAVADGFKTVEQAKNLLQKSGDFSQVTIRGAKADAGGKSVQFRLELRRAQPGGNA